MRLPISLASCMLIVSGALFAQQPGLTTSPVPAAAQKQQGQATTPALQQRQNNKGARLHGQPKIDPATAGSVQPTPGRNYHHGQGKLGNGNSQGGSKPSTGSGVAGLQKKDPPSYSAAVRRYRGCGRHDRSWWKQHFTIIVLVGGGYYYFDNGFWCPAWGYDSGNQYYDYDGPIYTYGNLLPDQVIANVQRALKELGYYTGEITGALKASTREAIAAYQEDNGLEITGVIDAETVAALGLD